MALRFFADHCVSNRVIEALREAGHEVLALRDHIPIESSDQVVISAAQELDCILISVNGDFADIVKYPPAQYKGIIALYVKNRPQTIGRLLERLDDHLSSHPNMRDHEGKLLTVERHRIRIRG